MSQPEESWKANQEFLHTIVSMGISHNIALEALFCTGNKSVDEAISYIFNNEECNEIAVPEGSVDSKQKFGSEESTDGEENYYKMIFVINTSLKMGVGKIAAQVGHACLGLYRTMQSQKMDELLSEWEHVGEKKIVLKGIDVEHLQELHDKAVDSGLHAYLVKDAGHTQIAPGSVTVLSIFGLEDQIDSITGKLSLL